MCILTVVNLAITHVHDVTDTSFSGSTMSTVMIFLLLFVE